MEENMSISQLDKQLLLNQLNELISYVYDPTAWDGNTGSSSVPQ